MMNASSEYIANAAAASETLVLEHAALVKRIAYHLISRMPPSVEVDDLIQAGMIGLLEAAKNYSETGGANFTTFAGIRIRGAMLDEVRKLDWTPRSIHRRIREVARVVRQIENRTGRDARDVDIAAALEMPLDEYHALVRDAASARLCSLEDVFGANDPSADCIGGADPDPLEDLQRNGFLKALSRAIEGLPEREKLVMSLYYDEELNLREIGEVIGVSESRVCQIHGQTLLRLRARLTDWTRKEPA